MSTNPDQINQLAAILREVDGSHGKGAADLAEAILGHPDMWQPPAALAQPEGQSMLNVNLKLDTSPECLKRLVDCLIKAVTPNGGYEAATTDDPAPGTGGDQMVQVQWWIPQHGWDSLENTLDAIKYRITSAVTDWWATALVSAALAQPEGEMPDLATIDEKELLRVYCDARRAYCHDGPEHVNWQRDAERGATLAGLGAVLARWGRPAALEDVGRSTTDSQRKTVRAAVAEALGGAYDCTRVWEAWQVGTMGPDDFELVAEDEERVAEIADAAIEALRPATPPPLPSSYIGFEHQGEELELLQTFYRACRAEGGTADEISLRGIRAVLAARPAAPPAPETMEAVGNCARIELLVALYSLASQFENETAAFTGDDLKAVQGHIRHARKIAARHNQNGPGCAPPAPEAGEVGEVVEWLESQAAHLRKMQEIGALPETELQEMLDRAATLLQQQEARIAALRSALADCGRAVRAFIADDCSDDFLLQVPAEVRLAAAKPAPAVVPVAVSERLPTMEAGDFDRKGRCWWGDPGGEQFVPSWRLCELVILLPFTHWLPAHAIPLPQAGKVKS
jgi:hypothetical protein